MQILPLLQACGAREGWMRTSWTWAVVGLVGFGGLAAVSFVSDRSETGVLLALCTGGYGVTAQFSNWHS